jgi:hypothetical protein
MLRLGKKPARFDKRTIQLKNVLKVLPPIPPEFDADRQYDFPIDNPMFRNGGDDALGDCVIAARAHMTRRFEAFEQKKLIPISDRDVVNEYWKESGGVGHDYGLELLSSLKEWRNGWKIGGRKIACLPIIRGQDYNIHAFMQITTIDPKEIMASIFFLNGAYVGLMLPMSAQDQYNNNQVWDVVEGPTGKPGSWGGHCVYVSQYDSTGPSCVTWGTKQPMTWPFFFACCDEAYGIVDDKDRFLDNSLLDVEKLEGYLQEITK